MPSSSEVSSAPPALAARDLDVGYGSFVVQHDLNFEVERGKIFVIMGGSGCGKSTVLRAMIGLLPPLRGDVAFGEASLWSADEAERERLTRRFGVLYWSFTLTATDANRFAIRWARHITGRPKILVHNHCYHGTVDETFAELDEAGAVIDRPGNTGPPVPVGTTTRVVEINDLDALERELSHGDVAVCMFEPALTNIGIVMPDPGYWETLEVITTRQPALPKAPWRR